jgi:hypothetical protein
MIELIQKRAGPYASTVAGLGGLPTNLPDIPISAVLLALFLGLAIANMTILQRNRRRNHRFHLNGLLFGFCMARVATLVLRIAWTTRPRSVRLAIAATIFLNAGILIVYIVNLILAQRILRAKQPHLGWNPVIRFMYRALYISIGLVLVAVISSVVISSYSLNIHTKLICRDVQLAALTFLLVFVCLPLLHIFAILLLPKSTDEEAFGKGGMRSKMIIVTVSTCLCIIIAGFKVGITWSPPRPVTHPYWFDSKACLYIFGFTIEILAVVFLTFTRIDKRFYVPDGCKGPGDYTRLAISTRDVLQREDKGTESVVSHTSNDIE